MAFVDASVRFGLKLVEHAVAETPSVEPSSPEARRSDTVLSFPRPRQEE